MSQAPCMTRGDLSYGTTQKHHSTTQKLENSLYFIHYQDDEALDPMTIHGNLQHKESTKDWQLLCSSSAVVHTFPSLQEDS